MVSEGVLTTEHLRSLVDDFRRETDIRLGSFLVGKGILSEDKLSVLLLKQDVRRGKGILDRHVEAAWEISKKVEERLLQQIDRLSLLTEKL